MLLLLRRTATCRVEIRIHVNSRAYRLSPGQRGDVTAHEGCDACSTRAAAAASAAATCGACGIAGTE